MATDARVAMYMRRGEDFTFLVRVRGPDISGSTFRMQVRDRAGTPGAALINLNRVTDDSAGLGVIDTRVVAGVIETIVRIRVPAALLQTLPYAPVIGAQKQLAFGFMIDGRTRLFGDLFVLDSAIDSDAAPLNRSTSAVSPVLRDAGGVQQGLTLSIAQDSLVDLTIDGADLLGPLATRAVDAIDTVEGIATTSYRAVATYGERESIPLDKRAPGMLVRVLEGSTDGGRVFIWNPDFAMPGAWTGLLNEEEKMRLDLMHGGLAQDKVYGLTGSLDALRDANAAVARVKVGNLRAELLAGGAATIAWTRDGARPDAQEVAWGDWSVPLSGDVERFDLRDWARIDRLFVAGNSLSDTTGGNGQWSQLLAQQLGVPLVSVARGSSDARQVYKTGARPLLLTLGGQLPPNGSAAITLINGVAPSLDSYVSPASFLNSYGGDATPASMTGYVTDGTTSRRVTVSIARSDSTDYRITQAAGGSAVTFAGPVLFTPDTVIEPARSLNALWIGNNYFFSGVPGAYGDNTNAQLWTDMAAIVRQWNGARGFILPILPATDWVARGPGTPYDAYIAANARTRSLYPRYWLTDAQGRDLVAYIQQLGSDGSAGDRDDIAKGFTPRSCRYDGLHLNAKGVGLVVAFLLSALPRQAMPPALAEGMTVRLTASGAGTADSAIAQVVRPASAALIDGVVSQSAYRPTLAAAVADFEVGTFFVSRDQDRVSAYPGEKRQYEIIGQAPFWADRGPFVGKADVGLDAVDNTADDDKPVSADQAAAIGAARSDALASTSALGLMTNYALDRRIRTDAAQGLPEADQAQARDNMGAGRAGASPLAMRPSIFSGARPVVPVSRPGMTKDDLSYLQDVVYAATDPNSGADVTDAVQQHLLDCYLIARGLKNAAWDNLDARSCVRAVLPRGKYNVSSPMVVPPHVELDVLGTLLRNNPAADPTTDTWDGDTAAQAFKDPHQPTVILGPKSHVGRIWINCSTSGVAAKAGSGLVSGKNWGISDAQVLGGAGYVVGDVLTGPNPDATPFIGFKLNVDAVDGAGAPTAWTVTDSGV